MKSRPARQGPLTGVKTSRLCRTGVGIFLALALCQDVTRAAERPNILFAFADDWGCHASAYAAVDGPGSPCDVVKTPNVDRLGSGTGKRVVHDFINLMDLAPTFLEAGGVTPPEVMTGRSFLGAIRSEASGWLDPQRNWVITGRERHVSTAREGRLPYPQRALRTQDYLYIVNFKPDRWPMGTPLHLEKKEGPSYKALRDNTRVTYQDIDASPTKAWLITHGGEAQWQKYYDYAFAKRPYEELYVLAKDPDQIHNVAERPEYDDIRRRLNAQLMEELKRTGDPRVTGDGSTFDKPPYAGN